MERLFARESCHEPKCIGDGECRATRLRCWTCQAAVVEETNDPVTLEAVGDRLDELANYPLGEEVALSFNKQLIEIPCSGCGHKTGKTFAWMKAHKKFVCRHCGATNELDLRQFRAEIKKVDRAFENLRRKLSGKR
jgi:hypothetical protein